MPTSLRPAFRALPAILLIAGCASHPRDFIPTGAGVDLAPTNPEHIQVLNEIPRGMVIGTILVDRAKAKNTDDIIAMARQKAAAVGGDFIVWEDSLGTVAVATPTPGAPAPPDPNTGSLAHAAAIDEPAPETMSEKSPKARFTVGIFLPEDHPGATQ